MRSSAFLLFALLLVAPVSCRVETSFNHTLKNKLAAIEDDRDRLRHPVSEEDRAQISANLSSVENELRAEEDQGRALPPRPSGAAVIGARGEALTAASLAFTLQSIRWHEEVWLQWALPDDRAAVENQLSDLKDSYQLVYATLRSMDGKPIVYTDEHKSLIHTAIEDRTRALATEKDPARHAFLESSLAWWREREAATPR